MLKEPIQSIFYKYIYVRIHSKHYLGLSASKLKIKIKKGIDKVTHGSYNVTIESYDRRVIIIKSIKCTDIMHSIVYTQER